MKFILAMLVALTTALLASQHSALAQQSFYADCGCSFPGGAVSAHFRVKPLGGDWVQVGQTYPIVALGGGCGQLSCNGGSVVNYGNLSMQVSQIHYDPSLPFYRFILSGRSTAPVTSLESRMFFCLSPHGDLGEKAPILRSPARTAQVPPKATVTLCNKTPRDKLSAPSRCIRTVSGSGTVRNWQCPVGLDCFGGGKFSNVRVEYIDEATAQTCIDFTSSQNSNQGVGVEFRAPRTAAEFIAEALSAP